MMVFFETEYQGAIMDAFLQRHSGQILGVLSGCDRVLFRGTLRSISYLDGMERLLASLRIPHIAQHDADRQRRAAQVRAVE